MDVLKTDEMGFCTLLRNSCIVCEQVSAGKMDVGFDLGSGESSPKLLNWLYQKNDAGDMLFHVNFSVDSVEMLETKCLLEAEEMLNGTFMDEERVLLLRDKIRAVRSKGKDLLADVSVEFPFPAYQMTVIFLDTYYGLLKECFRLRDSIKNSGLLERGFLNKIVNLGCESNIASLYSPPVMTGIRNVYDNLSHYYNIVAGIDSRGLKLFYREVFMSKVLRTFRWFLVRDGELYHAAIPPYYSEKYEDIKWRIGIPIRPLSEYSSFEGISELRLLDKIIYELERRKSLDVSEQKLLNITVIGDVNYKPMIELCDILKVMSTKADGIAGYKKLKIHFWIYTMNTVYIDEKQRKYDNECASYELYVYKNHLKDQSKIDLMLEQSHILFLLDPCDIYMDFDVKELDNIDGFWQRIASESYSKNYQQIQGWQDLSRRGNLTDLTNVTTAFLWKGQVGVLRKRANDYLLDYIKKQCEQLNKKENNDIKSVYIYVSDLNAFRNVYSNSRNFVRIERYNEKEIAIIRYSEFDERPLKIHENQKSKILVFNIWQVIKHVGARRVNMLAGDLDQGEGIPMLRELLVGIDYAEWPQCLRFTYYIPPDRFERKQKQVEDYLESVILPFFRKQEKNMYMDYFIKSMSSFLYSDAKCLDDMLFLHMFQDQHDLLKETELISGNDMRLPTLKRTDGKYSQKRFYGDIMKDYDTSSEMFALKFTKLEQIEKEGDLERETMFRNIVEVCEENHYKDSYLYNNCLNML